MKHHNLLFTNEGILFSDSTKMCTIAYRDIIFFMTDRPYIIVKTEKKEHIHIQISMSQIAKSLPNNFCMCSQSVIVNLSYVNAYEERQHVFWVYLKNACTIKVSRRYRNSFKVQIISFKKMMNYT